MLMCVRSHGGAQVVFKLTTSPEAQIRRSLALAGRRLVVDGATVVQGPRELRGCDGEPAGLLRGGGGGLGEAPRRDRAR